MLETEISYALSKLPEALGRIGEATPQSIGAIFKKASALLTSGEGYTPQEAWEIALDHCYKNTALLPEDLEILLAFGRSLGSSGREDQLRHLNLACERLRLQEVKAREEAERNVRMWRYLGISVGAMIVLLLY